MYGNEKKKKNIFLLVICVPAVMRQAVCIVRNEFERQGGSSVWT